MALRTTQSTTYQQVLLGIQNNTQRLVQAQAQVATGRRISRPSDDPVGTATSINLRQQISNLASYQSSVDEARPIVETAASEIEQASNFMTEARALMLQGLSGTLSQDDRNSIADQIEEVANGLLGVANARFGDRFLFAGTDDGVQPYTLDGEGPDRFASYGGNGDEQTVAVNRGVGLELNVPGSELFSGAGYTSTSFAGLTGLQSGLTVDQGTGFTRVQLRADSVSGFEEGVVQAAGTALTVLGEHALVIDADDQTVTLGDGEPVLIPTPLPSALTVETAGGGSVTLDLSGWTGLSSTASLVAEGSIATNGADWTPVDRTETDLELVIDGVGVIHVDTTELSRTGEELITFQGTTSVFDTLLGAAQDLRDGATVGVDVARARLQERYSELIDQQSNTLVGLGRLGARARRLNETQERLDELSIQYQDQLSRNEDADLTEVALDLTRTEQTLQVALASGARLLQQTLLNFL